MKIIFVCFLVMMSVSCGDSNTKKSPVNTNNQNQNPNNSGACGDGELNRGESCDPGIENGEGACPESCAAPACSTATIEGSPNSCDAVCVVEPVACSNGDGCCALGCDANSDDDCTNICGDGTVDDPETCDGDCPTSCDDSDACTIDTLSGDAETCSAACSYEAIDVCENGDGCCPSGCTASQDDDCEPSNACGDGILDAGELCDGDCPASCDDGESCTTDQLVGSEATCDARCLFSPINACVNNDGCCASGCTSANDNDCNCIPDTCNGLGFECGSHDNGCNGTVSCGNCPQGEACNGGICVGQPGDGSVGSSCASAMDCAADATGMLPPECRAEPGGYCSFLCIPLLPLFCGDTAACITDVANPQAGVCRRLCNNNNDCRSGYSCQSLTDGKVCVPN